MLDRDFRVVGSTHRARRSGGDDGAPQEYRGPFGVVATSEPTTYFSELMVEQAKIMDKLAIAAIAGEEIRSAANDALLLLQELNTTFDRRKDAILTVGQSQ